MKTVRIHKAQRFSAGTVVESVTIELHDELPYDERSESQVTVQERFASDAKALRDALRCLPGGTADQLLRLLLEDRASLLVVPRPGAWETPDGGDEVSTVPIVLCPHGPETRTLRKGNFVASMYCSACNATLEQRSDGHWYIFALR